MKNVLIADDHEIVRKGIRMIIENRPGNYQFCETATCAETARLLTGQKIDYAIVDMFLADGSVFSIMEAIASRSKDTSIIVYSMNKDRIYAKRFLEKGIRGFVCKQSSIEELEKAIEIVFSGEIYLSPGLKESLFQSRLLQQPPNPIDMLSDRELEVVDYFVLGMGTKEIAKMMNVDTTTVSTYRRRAFEKMDVQNVIELKEKMILYKDI